MRKKRSDVSARLIFSAETLICLLLAYPFRQWLNKNGLGGASSIPVDLLFILPLIVAVFVAGEYLRRGLGVKSLFRDQDAS
jgi:hypothetical protein